MSRQTVYFHIRRLGIRPRKGEPKNVLFITKEQSQAITESIETARKVRRDTTAVFVDGERAAALLSALRDGKTALDLVIDLKATTAEADRIRDWWLEQNEIVLVSKAEMDHVSELLGQRPNSGTALIDALIELTTIAAQRTPCSHCGEESARLCAECAQRIHRPAVLKPMPKQAKIAAPKVLREEPLPPVSSPEEEARLNRLKKILAFDPRKDSDVAP